MPTTTRRPHGPSSAAGAATPMMRPTANDAAGSATSSTPSPRFVGAMANAGADSTTRSIVGSARLNGSMSPLASWSTTPASSRRSRSRPRGQETPPIPRPPSLTATFRRTHCRGRHPPKRPNRVRAIASKVGTASVAEAARSNQKLRVATKWCRSSVDPRLSRRRRQRRWQFFGYSLRKDVSASRSRRTPKPVPPLTMWSSALSVLDGPAMSRWTHGMSSATNSRRNKPAVMAPP